jgi:hypothetical protein
MQSTSTDTITLETAARPTSAPGQLLHQTESSFPNPIFTTVIICINLSFYITKLSQYNASPTKDTSLIKLSLPELKVLPTASWRKEP